MRTTINLDKVDDRDVYSMEFLLKGLNVLLEEIRRRTDQGIDDFSPSWSDMHKDNYKVLTDMIALAKSIQSDPWE